MRFFEPGDSLLISDIKLSSIYTPLQLLGCGWYASRASC